MRGQGWQSCVEMDQVAAVVVELLVVVDLVVAAAAGLVSLHLGAQVPQQSSRASALSEKNYIISFNKKNIWLTKVAKKKIKRFLSLSSMDYMYSFLTVRQEIYIVIDVIKILTEHEFSCFKWIVSQDLDRLRVPNKEGN